MNNDVQINCIYDICVSTFWTTGVWTIFYTLQCLPDMYL